MSAHIPPELTEPQNLPRDLQQMVNTNTRPVATAVLLERLRLQRLWLAVEQATSAEYYRAMARFRRGLGLEA